jgi:hypothetical protein
LHRPPLQIGAGPAGIEVLTPIMVRGRLQTVFAQVNAHLDHLYLDLRLTQTAPGVTMDEQDRTIARKEALMRARFLGKDPDSQEGQSPTLFATDRTDRRTYIAQGWRVTDPQALADVGPVPDHETLIEIPEEVLRFYARRYEQDGGPS